MNALSKELIPRAVAHCTQITQWLTSSVGIPSSSEYFVLNGLDTHLLVYKLIQTEYAGMKASVTRQPLYIHEYWSTHHKLHMHATLCRYVCTYVCMCMLHHTSTFIHTYVRTSCLMRALEQHLRCPESWCTSPRCILTMPAIVMMCTYLFVISHCNMVMHSTYVY